MRVITPAWKKLPVYQRVLKVTEALNHALPSDERSKIFRVSVLTSNEYKKLQAFSLTARKTRSTVKKRIVGKMNGVAA